jgi:hypothetical protein
MYLAMRVTLFALTRNRLAMGKYYHGVRRENRETALTPRSRLGSDPAKPPAPNSCLPLRCVRRVAGSRVLRTLCFAPLAPSAHDPGLNSAQRKPKA